VFITISCNLPADIENKKNNENKVLLETIELVDKVFDNLNITLDTMIERLNESDNEISKLEKRIDELERNVKK
jgi:uncharacterized protein Yka (UPF0111/DUF47 family)